MESDYLKQKIEQLTQENAALEARVAHLDRVEHTLNAILKGTASQTGDDFFVSLVKYLAETLNAKYALIGELSGRHNESIRTIAYWRDGKLGENFLYPLAGSPCAQVIENGVQYHEANTWKQFPEDEVLTENQIECYIGAPLLNASGQPLGVLVVLHDQILEMVHDSVPIITIFAARAGAELERMHSEETLRTSERRYRHLIEESNEAIYLVYNGRFELANDRFCRLFEISQADVLAGKLKTRDLVAPESRSLIKERSQQVKTGELTPQRYEFMAQTRNGRTFPVEVSVSYVNYKGGTAVQGLLRDLTERKQAEAAERSQRELAEALHEIGLALSASLDVEIVLDLLLEQLDRVVPYDSATVIEVQKGQTHIVRARGYEKFGIALDTTQKPRSMDVANARTWQTLIETKRPLIIPDINCSDLWSHSEHNPHVRSWACAPILIGGEVVAFLSTNKLQPDFYTDEHGQRLAAFAGQAALALQNARLFAASAERTEALHITSEILRSLNAASNIQDAFPSLVNNLKMATRCQRVTLAQMDETRQWADFIALHDEQNKLGQTLRLHVSESAATDDLLHGRVHIVPDITTELDYRAGQLLHNAGYQSYIALPLLVNDSTKGVLTLSWTRRQDFESVKLPLIQQIASVIALGLERSALFAKTHARTQELNLLNKVISAAASGQTENTVMQILCLEIAQYLSITHVTLIELDESMTTGRVMAQYLDEAYKRLAGRILRLEADSALLTAVTQTQSPFVVPVLSQFPLTPGMAHLVKSYHLVSALLVPISLRGKLIGIMGIGSETMRAFNPEEIRLIQTVCEELGRILETARLYDQLRAHAAELEERVAERTSELAEANEQLKELDILKSQFVSDVSHELRTPVTNLKLYLDLLEHKGSVLLPKYLPILQKQADRLGQLIQDILDLSRLDIRHNSRPGFGPVDLNSIAHDVIVAHQPRAEVTGLHLTFSPCPDLPLIIGDRNQLAQIVTNLLANAINYTVAGTIDVKISLTPSQKQVCLTVEDTGIGIYEDDLAYLFNRFYRGQQARQSNIPGTGLGLAIAQEIVRLHGGHIEVYSVINRGSTFSVFLPVASQTELDDAQ
jgi:PAS domain S-box-containing protein